MLAPVTHILPLTTIRRERLLPVQGKVIVRKGQKVAATDTLAEANLAPEHLLLDLERGLGLRGDRSDEYLQVKEGAQVAAGDVVAGPVGLTRRVIRSPRNGRVVLAGGGQVLIEAQGQPFELKAGMPAQVVELITDRGAIIEATGSLIQGVWGNERIDAGLLTLALKSPEDELERGMLDVSMRGAVVLGGMCRELEILRSAAEIPLRGLILTSMDPSLAKEAAQMSLPVIVIEGFGQRPMNPAAFKLLTTNERRELALNAEPWDPYAATRPEIVIALPAAEEQPLPKDTDMFAAGQQVRIVRAPFAGRIGTLVDLRGMATLPSGLRALSAEVRMENGDSVVLPLANLEVLE